MKKFTIILTLAGILAAVLGSIPPLDGIKLTLDYLSVPFILVSLVLWIVLGVRALGRKRRS